MPFCGFNQKMLEGLTPFYEGLVEHGLIDRAKKKGKSVEQILKNELNNMERILEETNRIKDHEKRETIETLTRHAISFYNFVEEQGIDNYKSFIRGLVELYRKMDDKFYSELEGKQNDMKQLAEYLSSERV